SIGKRRSRELQAEARFLLQVLCLSQFVSRHRENNPGTLGPRESRHCKTEIVVSLSGVAACETKRCADEDRYELIGSRSVWAFVAQRAKTKKRKASTRGQGSFDSAQVERGLRGKIMPEKLRGRLRVPCFGACRFFS